MGEAAGAVRGRAGGEGWSAVPPGFKESLYKGPWVSASQEERGSGTGCC